MTHFGNKVRHSNNKTSYINNEATGISVWTVQDEFFKAVIMPKDEKDPKNEKALRKDAKDKIYRLAPQVAAEFEPGYDTKALKMRVHEVARKNGLKVRLSPEEIEAINAKRQEAAERREFREALRKQQDEVASKVASLYIKLLYGVRFKAGWQREKCLRMCVKETLEQYTLLGDKVLDDTKVLMGIYTKCVKALGGVEVYNY